MLPVIAGAGAAIAALAAIDKFSEYLSDKGLPKYFGRINSQLLGRLQGTNLMDYTQPARMEPVCLLDDQLLSWTHTQALLDTSLSVYTSILLTAVNLDNTVAGVSLMKRIDKFGTNRSLVTGARSVLANESMFGLPTPALDVEPTLPKFTDKFRESIPGYRTENFIKDWINKPEPEVEPQVTADTSDSTKMATEVTNLAVGKLFSVSLENNGQKSTMMLQIRLIVNRYPQGMLTNIVSLGSEDNSMKARFRKYRAGEISAWRDGIMCADLLDRHYATLLHDKTRYYQTMYDRQNSNFVVEMLTGEPSVGTESSIILLTKETAALIESRIGGRLADFEVRQRVFGRTMSMLIAVVNTDRDLITFYHRGVSTPTELTASDIKRRKDGKDEAIYDLMKMFMNGNAPARF